jgi:hypothetical protein
MTTLTTVIVQRPLPVDEGLHFIRLRYVIFTEEHPVLRFVHEYVHLKIEYVVHVSIN